MTILLFAASHCTNFDGETVNMFDTQVRDGVFYQCYPRDEGVMDMIAMGMSKK